MSNPDVQPHEVECAPHRDAPTDVQIVDSREVPLGGPRALTVRRTLPHRERSFVGAWCFADHYGPADTRMDVPPHPHTSLQTVSWLFEGEVEHRDSIGTHTLIRPGEMNLMTSGHGITHSEVSTERSGTLHGVQLWVALPQQAARGPRDFQSHVTEPVDVDDAVVTPGGGASIRVFLGEVAGVSSPVTTATPLLGAELTLARGTQVELPVRGDFEHGVLVDKGEVWVEGEQVAPTQLGFVAQGHDSLHIAARGESPARVILLGGEPFDEDIIMWWNFVGRTHDEIVEARAQWQAQGKRFGRVDGYEGQRPWLPAPELPGVRLKSRRRR